MDSPQPQTPPADLGPLSLDRTRPMPEHQPFVHDLLGVFHAPVQAWARADGEMTGRGAEGIYLGDTRIVSDLRCAPIGASLSHLGTQVDSPREAVVRSVVSEIDSVVDPIVTLERLRTADADGISETLRLRSDDDRPRRLRLRFGLLTDGASMSAVKDPRMLEGAPDVRPDARLEDGAAVWSIGVEGRAALTVDPASAAALAIDGPQVTWEIELEVPARGSTEASWRLSAVDPAVPFSAATAPWTASAVAEYAGTVDAQDPERRAAARLLRRSLADLDALRLQRPDQPAHTFLAAGAPWFFTLFGRDSLIAASLLLPVTTDVAIGTLRTLAAAQGTRRDVLTAEQPGKILHEVRAAGMEMGETHLPPVYYGTIDATPLWIELLYDTLAAGADPALLTELRPSLVGAATWLLEHADADGDGLLEYLDESGHGLANQGWKDSGDSIRFADGSLAEGTIALSEVQGYAFAAALHAAALLEQSSGADAGAGNATDVGAGAGADSGAAPEEDLPARLRAWADRLRERFHATFWCEDELGVYPALALDGQKRPVTGVASNMGHLLGTGILDREQEELVVRRLLDPSMYSGYGIRTLSTTNGGFGPLRYHGGSVWTHDTGYILRGILRTGDLASAHVLARGLLRAAEGFDDRLPELFGGHDADRVDPPLPYPASCRPQAWAAASAVPIAQALELL